MIELPPDWVVGAPCGQTDPDLFYPAKGEPSRSAKRVCQSCPVRAKCLDYAVANHETYGIWGGLTARERRPLHAAAVELGTVAARTHCAAGHALTADNLYVRPSGTRCRACAIAHDRTRRYRKDTAA